MYVRAEVLGALLVVTVALSTSATVGQEVAPGPVPRAESRFEVASLPVPAELVQAVLDFPPGTVVPAHVHVGAAYVTILAGELLVEGPDGPPTYRAGDTLVEQPGQVYAAANPGDTPASLVVTYLVPKGAPVTTVVAR